MKTHGIAPRHYVDDAGVWLGSFAGFRRQLRRPTGRQVKVGDRTVPVTAEVERTRVVDEYDTGTGRVVRRVVTERVRVPVVDAVPLVDEAGAPVLAPDGVTPMTSEVPRMTVEDVLADEYEDAVETVDAAPPDGAIEVPSPPPDAADLWDGQTWRPALAPRRAAAVEAVDRHAAEILAAGFAHGGAVFQADAEARANIAAVATGIAAGKGTPPAPDPWGWWDVDNVVHVMTEAGFLTFAAAHRDWAAAVKVAARRKKDAIEAAADAAELATWLAANPVDEGWPR